MVEKKQVDHAASLFRELLAQGDAPMVTKAGPKGGAAPRTLSVPHPYFVVDGDAVLEGKFTGAERMTGYQSVVLEGETPVEVLIASADGDEMSYAAGWSARAAEALTEALRVAERNGISDDEFAVVTVPEVAFNAVWYRERRELVPLGLGSKKGALDPSRVYSETEVIEMLREPLRGRFRIYGSGTDEEGAPKPPRA